MVYFNSFGAFNIIFTHKSCTFWQKRKILKYAPQMNVAVILGSSNKNGKTKKQVRQIISVTNWDLIDLLDYNISHFDYQHHNKNDDFLDLIRRIVNTYDVLIFATPVYWYSMSGIMKVFFDRLTDLLTIEKEIGRGLRNKYMAVISNSNGDNLGNEFWLPFKKTAEYLGMKYTYDLHTIKDIIDKEALDKFIANIKESTTK